MDLVRNEERAAEPSERVGARQKHRQSYRAPPSPLSRRYPSPVPRPWDRTRLIDAGASRRRANLDSGGS